MAMARSDGAAGARGAEVAVTVVIPTVRQRFLAAALDSLARQRTALPFEVLVIENGTRGDDTEALVAARARHGRVAMRYHFIAQPGANPARNVGTAMARGAIVALTDDDCVMADDWIDAIRRAHDAFPGAACIGGAVELDFLVAPPPWLVGVFRLMLAGIDWPREAADGDGPTTDITHVTDRYLVSANLSYRPAVFERIGGFGEDLVAPDQLSRNDEALFLDGARRLGGPGLLFDRRIRVRHQIPAERMEPDYFERKFRALAVATVAYHRRARLYANASPPFASDAEALCNTLLQHEMATGVIERQIAEARAILGADPAARRQFVCHLLRCKVVWLAALHAGIAADAG
jgi:glycosyltransferase involved in cell wall biosynthesis